MPLAAAGVVLRSAGSVRHGVQDLGRSVGGGRFTDGEDLAALADRWNAISLGYAEREGVDRDDDWFLLQLQEELGELTQMRTARAGRSRPRGMSGAELDQRLVEECAEVLGHLLLFARCDGVDLDRALRENWLRWERGA